MGLLKQKNRWILHIIFWVFYNTVYLGMLLQVLSFKEAFSRLMVSLILHLIVAYSNWFYLIPQYFYQKKYYLYFLSIVSIIFISTILRVQMEERFMGMLPQVKQFPLVRYAFNFFSLNMIWITSSLFKLLEDYVEATKRELIFKTGKLEAELKLLKSQINPHFLFNTLNNVYSLVYLKSDEAAPMVLKLSGILRYMLYECDIPKVPVQKEIDYLRDCIDLQILNPKDKHKVKFEVENHAPDLMIEPLLFINFLENSFKHSSISSKQGFIHLKMDIQPKSIDFQIENSILPTDSPKDKVGGIGLQNVKQRLELVYPKRHTLEVAQKDNSYRIRLVLELE